MQITAPVPELENNRGGKAGSHDRKFIRGAAQSLLKKAPKQRARRAVSCPNRRFLFSMPCLLGCESAFRRALGAVLSV